MMKLWLFPAEVAGTAKPAAIRAQPSIESDAGDSK